VQALIGALGDGDSQVRESAAAALGLIGDARAVEPLIAALADWDWDLSVAETAAEALGKIGAPAVEPLIAALAHTDQTARQFAATALDRLDWRPDEGAAGAAYWIVRGEWERCVQIGAPAVEPLIVALDKFELNVYCAAAAALVRIGDARAVKPLIAKLQDSSMRGSHRRSAAEALVALYQSGRLDEEHQRLALAQRPTITSAHDDYPYHEDEIFNGCHFHDDRIKHEDSGIGGDFPV
jgi:HEAT repeat protein